MDSLFSTSDGGKAKNFKVVIRIRPMNSTETGRNEANALTVPDKHTIEVEPDKGSDVEVKGPRGRRASTLSSYSTVGGSNGKGTGSKTYHYDRVYGPAEDQAHVYASAVNAVVQSTLEGYNGSIIAYGQTGTGKTHTMEGDIEGEQRGVIPRASEQIFDFVKGAGGPNVQYKVSVSFLQIYNEKILDLLDAKVSDGKWKPDEDFSLDVHEKTPGETYVAGLSEHEVDSPEQVLALLKRGSAARTTASTSMNRQSSRSHAVFAIIIEKTEQINEGVSVTVGRLNLVDLAGSERVKSTGIEGTGKRMDEAKSINGSLSAFGKVILALTTGIQHVPYRDSKLTRILQGSLGGNCKTTMIAAIGPAATSGAESISTLKFASRAKKVKNYAVVNQDMTDKAMLSQYEKEIARLQEELKRTRAETQSSRSSSTKAPQSEAPQSGSGDDGNDSQAAEIEALEDKLRSAEGLVVRSKSELSESMKERAILQKKIGIMETMLLESTQKERRTSMEMSESSSGHINMAAITGRVEETSQFQSKLAESEQRIKKQIMKKYESKVAELKQQRNLNKKDRAALGAERAELAALRSELESGTGIGSASEPELAAKNASFHREKMALDAEKRAFAEEKRKFEEAKAQPQRPSILSGGNISSTGSSGSGQQSNWMERGTGSASSADAEPVAVPTRPLRRPSLAEADEAYAEQARAYEEAHEGGLDVEEYDGGGRAAAADADAEAEPVGGADTSYDVYLQALRHPQTGIPMHTARYNHQYYRNVFTGQDAASWFQSNLEGIDDLNQAEGIGQKFVNWGTIIPLTAVGIFQASYESLYRFNELTPEKTGVSKRQLRPATPVRVRQSKRYTDLQEEPPTSPTSPPNATRPHTSQSESSSSLRPQSTRARGRESRSAGGDYMSPSPPPSSEQRPKTGGMRRRISKVFSMVGGAASNDESTQRPRPPTRSAASSIRDLDPSFKDCGATLLHSAAGQGDRTAMKTFFQTFPVDCTDNLGRTPLMYACCTNRIKSVELLLKQGCDVTLQDSDGRTGLLWAAYYGHHDILRMLLKVDRNLAAHVGPDGRSAIHWASKHPSTKCLDILLRAGPSNFVNLQDTEKHTALHWAILCQHHEHALKLLRAGANPGLSDAQQRNALHYAVVNESQMCLQVLLQNLESIDIINQPDEKKRTPLHLAITKKGPIDTVLLLLSLPGINVDALDFRMTAPLHWAAVCGRTDMCKALVARGATLNLRDANGMTPLHYADDKGHSEAALVLQRLQQTRRRAQTPGSRYP